jgi:hypothetical protein
VVRRQARRAAEKSIMVWSKTARKMFVFFSERCTEPSPHKLTRASGRYTEAIDRHSSALIVPALASPKLEGTEPSQDGVAVSLMTLWMCSSTSGVQNFRFLVAAYGLVFRYSKWLEITGLTASC